jgi:hypothetical protein
MMTHDDLTGLAKLIGIEDVDNLSDSRLKRDIKSALHTNKLFPSRGINRIYPFCEELAKGWKNNNQLRFGQMMICVFADIEKDDKDIFDIEDSEMLAYIKVFLHSNETQQEKGDSNMLKLSIKDKYDLDNLTEVLLKNGYSVTTKADIDYDDFDEDKDYTIISYDVTINNPDK